MLFQIPINNHISSIYMYGIKVFSKQLSNQCFTKMLIKTYERMKMRTEFQEKVAPKMSYFLLSGGFMRGWEGIHEQEIFYCMSFFVLLN